MTNQQLGQTTPVPTQAVYFLVSADGNQTMIIETVPKQLADRSILDNGKLADRISELAKRLSNGKEHRLVWNDDEDDIFVTLDTVKRMNAAIDFAMWQSPAKPIVRILAKPVLPSPHSSSTSPISSWSSSSPLALSDASMEDETRTVLAASAATIYDATDAAEDDDTAVASVVAFCVTAVSGDGEDDVAVDAAILDAEEAPDDPMEEAAATGEDETDKVAAAESGLQLLTPVEKKTPGRPKKRPSDAPVFLEKRKPGRPRKSLILESPSANSPSVRPRRMSSLINCAKDNDVSMTEPEDQEIPNLEYCGESEASMKEAHVQEKRKPGRPRKSILPESPSAHSPSVRQSRKQMLVDENENDVTMTEPSDQDTIKSEYCEENVNSIAETSVQEKRKPGRPRKNILIVSPVPNAATVGKPQKIISVYFGINNEKEFGQSLQEKQMTGRTRKSLMVEPANNEKDTSNNENAHQERKRQARPRMSLPANFTVPKDEKEIANTVQEKKRLGRPPRKSTVVNCPGTISPILQPPLHARANHDNSGADTEPAIADKLTAEFEEWRGMRTIAAVVAVVGFNPASASAAEDNSYETRAMRLLSETVRRHENRRKERELINQENIRVKTEIVQTA